MFAMRGRDNIDLLMYLFRYEIKDRIRYHPYVNDYSLTVSRYDDIIKNRATESLCRHAISTYANSIVI